jgi:hypothetical protein
MSRTDHHSPRWVTARWVPVHAVACNARRAGCDLPSAPRVGAPGYGRQRERPVYWRAGLRYARPASRCDWEWVDVLRTGYRRYHPGVPKWFRDHRHTNPQRVANRVCGRAAVAEYRAAGEVATEWPDGRHRHAAAWDWT